MSQMVAFQKFLAEVLVNPEAKRAFDRAQKQPIRLRINGAEYHRRQRRRGRK